MSRDDWFRKTSWSEDDRKGFLVRLNRARPSSRGQYLRIQASHLQGAGLVAPALELLEMMLKEYPDKTHVAQALLQTALCLEDLERLDEAETSYRAALDAERRFPNSLTQAWVDFGWFVVSHDRRGSYADAIKVLDEREGTSSRFPIDRYRSNAIRAIVALERGDRAVAKMHALAALRAAAETRSGFRYHHSVGLVRHARGRVHEKVVELAG